ncbi:hypothetical protein H5410_049320 [Solanum commersonii]|uniref:Uncharacterized protein n=1 Tax=Solanum commersonii TaxID=4109 RepID=A0A9J5WTU5_SOLCO|nr:hypothetical protein H5410_049320 [Solanum commersonii]
MDPVGRHGQNGPFTRSNDTQSTITTSFMPKNYMDFHKTIATESVGFHGLNSPFTRSKEPQSSPRHFMVTQNSDVIYAKNLRPPLRI